MRFGLFIISCIFLFAQIILTNCGETKSEWVARIEGGPLEAERIALEKGYYYKGQVLGFRDTYILHKINSNDNTKRSGQQVKPLRLDKRVKWADEQREIQREKRDLIGKKGPKSEQSSLKPEYQTFYNEEGDHKVPDKQEEQFNDELWSQEWYLQDTRSGKTLPKLDLNVLPVYQRGITGRGIRVSILDDGIEYTHDDLKDNYDAEISYDCNEGDDDPTPRYQVGTRNGHGTRCAGEVAMSANNGKCGVGVAFNARIGGIKLLDGIVNDRIEGEALAYAKHLVDIYSASWGPSDDGRTLEGPGRLAREAIRQGIREGRKGKGVIYVWASGNGGSKGDNCNCDGYAGSIYTVSIGSASQKGGFPWYGELCPSTLAVTYSSGAYEDQMIMELDPKAPKRIPKTTRVNPLECLVEIATEEAVDVSTSNEIEVETPIRSPRERVSRLPRAVRRDPMASSTATMAARSERGVEAQVMVAEAIKELSNSCKQIAESYDKISDKATTDLNNGCTVKHTGTSASAPLAAGIIALALEANPDLTWRDVQHLIVWTAEYAPLQDNTGWLMNQAGFRYNPRFGFGLMNADALVKKSMNWTKVPENIICSIKGQYSSGGVIRRGQWSNITFTTSDCIIHDKWFQTKDRNDEILRHLEHVEVEVNLEYPRRGVLEMYLISPAGTYVQVLGTRRLDDSSSGFRNWKLMSVATWGEDPRGVWVLQIGDMIGDKNHTGKILSMRLNLHGTAETPSHAKNGPRYYNDNYNRRTYEEGIDSKGKYQIMEDINKGNEETKNADGSKIVSNNDNLEINEDYYGHYETTDYDEDVVSNELYFRKRKKIIKYLRNLLYYGASYK